MSNLAMISGYINANGIESAKEIIECFYIQCRISNAEMLWLVDVWLS